MKKSKINYSCNECGTTTHKWAGQCPDCGSWNSLQEIVITNNKGRFTNYSGDASNKIVEMQDVAIIQNHRFSTLSTEFDRTLGGGVVPGAVILLGGDPGIGKSTIVLQTFAKISKDHKVLYVTGEESLSQVKLRAIRLGYEKLNIPLLTETNIESILHAASKTKPAFMVIDSIQTVYTNDVQSAPGSVSQVREATSKIVQFAKTTNTAVFLIGHVTKEGAIAGPRILEHMVDTVLYFEGESSGKFRMLRAKKNRFGAVNELGIFAMTDLGLKEVSNPSAIFLSRTKVDACGSIITVGFEGSRPLLVEIQALVDDSSLASPRRVCVGFDQNRLALILAVLHRHSGIYTYNQDIFINVVGGAKIMDTSADLAILVAVVSSLKNRSLQKDTVIFGEVGLSQELRPVQGGQERLKEAAKLGFKTAIIPIDNAGKSQIKGINIIPCQTLQEVLEKVF